MYGSSVQKITIILIGLFLISSVFLAIPLCGNISEENEFRSTSLQLIEEETDNSIIYSYVNTEGKVTFAADKHYATMERIENEDIVVLERYYDEDGKPARQPLDFYAIRYEYMDRSNDYSLIYLDADGNPTVTAYGYAKILRIINNNGLIEEELYFDINNQPVETLYWGYGRRIEYDTESRPSRIIYIDINGKPIVSGLGYAMVSRSFYEDGPYADKIENEFYFDNNGEPISLREGEFGAHNEYDQLGRVNSKTYLDIDGMPLMIREGYAIVKRTFYPDDTIRTETYFDADGVPVALLNGQYGILKEKGRIIFLDRNGRSKFGLKNYLYKNLAFVIISALLLVVLSMTLGNRGRVVLFISYIAVVVYMTLMKRPIGDMQQKIELLWSYRQFFTSASLRLEIVNNIWLFVPLGALLFKFKPKLHVLIWAVLLTVTIETIQYMTGLGLAEFDDVISNTIGALIGFGIANCLEPLIQKIVAVHEVYRE